MPLIGLLDCIRSDLSKDPSLKEPLDKIQMQSDNTTCFKYRDDLIFFSDRIYVPDIPRLRKQLIMVYHDSLIGGRYGIHAIIFYLSTNFYWPYLRKDVKSNVQIARYVCKLNRIIPLQSVCSNHS